MCQHHAYRLSRLFTIISLIIFLAALSVINGSYALATPAERDAALQLLTEKSSKKRGAGIDALAASGDPAAAPILAAMADGEQLCRLPQHVDRVELAVMQIANGLAF